jgi:hypothetical protein
MNTLTISLILFWSCILFIEGVYLYFEIQASKECEKRFEKAIKRIGIKNPEVMEGRR